MTNLLGDIKTGKELGYSSNHKYIRVACLDCGKPRWVRLVKGKPQSPRCKSCSQLGDKSHNWGKQSPNWIGGQYLEKRGYVRVFAPTHPRCYSNGYIRRATLVLETKLGRYLLPNCVAHHINGIKDDDRPDNLKELLYKKHQGLHNRQLKKAEHMRKFRHPVVIL